MKYIIYTDGSCLKDQSKSAASYIIRTDYKFLDCNAESFTGIFIIEAELKAIEMSLSSLKKICKLTEEDLVIVNVDSIEAVEQCRTVLNGGQIKLKTSVYRDLVKVIKYIKDTGAIIEFRKVHAHKQKMNTNKFVDRLAKSAIQHADIF